jgi:ribosomal protein S18 acetylase RimI-like enzyme
MPATSPDSAIYYFAAMPETMSKTPVAAQRVIGAFRRHGAAAIARRIASRTLYMRETHLWYELDLARHVAHEPEPDIEVVEATPELLPAVQRIQPARDEVRQQRLAQGARLWAAIVDDELAFVCWTFFNETPVLVARGGSLPLPEGVGCLEDSVVAPEFRGRGIAPAVWRVLSARLLQDGVDSLITKVAVENVSSCRAVVKAGFEEVAATSAVRIGPRLRVDVHATRTGSGPHLAQRLSR